MKIGFLSKIFIHIGILFNIILIKYIFNKSEIGLKWQKII
jgi:hypothetical protein